MNAPPSTPFLLPSVDREVRVGCGLCELACITEKPAIRVLPREVCIGKSRISLCKRLG